MKRPNISPMINPPGIIIPLPNSNLDKVITLVFVILLIEILVK